MNDFSSALSAYISEFLMCRDAFGYKTDEHLRLLRSFDGYFLSNGYKVPVLPQEAVMGWVFKGTTGSPKDRAAIMRAFGKYLRDAGVPSFIPPTGLFGTSTHNRPYAFNGDELRRLFIEIDDASGKSKNP